MELIKYRDVGMATYTYFWKNKDNHTVSPFFDSESDAMGWFSDKGYEVSTHEKQQEFEKIRNYEWDEWKANKDIV